MSTLPLIHLATTLTVVPNCVIIRARSSLAHEEVSSLKRFFLCLFILSGVSFLYGQSTFGTIVGVVKDPAGAVIAQAQVAVTNEGTNVTQRTSTDQNGRYEVSHLNPGSYTVALQSTGFAQFQDRNILLETGQILRIDVQLSLGSVSETISV